jgi:hypothetical protein
MKATSIAVILVALGLLTGCSGAPSRMYVTPVLLNDGQPLVAGTYMVDTQSNPDEGGTIDQQHYLLRVEEDGTQHWINTVNTAGPKDIHVLGNGAISSVTGIAVTILNNDTRKSIAHDQNQAAIKASQNSSSGDFIILNHGGDGGRAAAGTQTGVDIGITSQDIRNTSPPGWLPSSNGKVY